MRKIPSDELKSDWQDYVMGVLKAGLMPTDIKYKTVYQGNKKTRVIREEHVQIAMALIKLRFAFDIDEEIPTSVALSQVTLVNGVLDIQGKLALALIRKHSKDSKIHIQLSDELAKMSVDRYGDGDVVNEYTFSHAQAAVAGLTTKDTYQQFEMRMLGWKVAGLLGAFEFPEITQGLGDGTYQIVGHEENVLGESTEAATLNISSGENIEELESEPNKPQIPENIEKSTIETVPKGPQIDESSEATKSKKKGFKLIKKILKDDPVPDFTKPSPEEEAKLKKEEEKSIELDLDFLDDDFQEKDAKPVSEPLNQKVEIKEDEVVVAPKEPTVNLEGETQDMVDAINENLKEVSKVKKKKESKSKSQKITWDWSLLDDPDQFTRFVYGDDFFLSERQKRRLNRDIPYSILNETLSRESLKNGWNYENITKSFGEALKNKSRNKTLLEVLRQAISDNLTTEDYLGLISKSEKYTVEMIRKLIVLTDKIFENNNIQKGSDYFKLLKEYTKWNENDKAKNFHLWVDAFLTKRGILITDGEKYSLFEGEK